MATLMLKLVTSAVVLYPLFAVSFFDKLLSGLWVALGLGLVIFFHELGHFAVAKWCDVNVERFSIGFGPILWSFKRGETEYALSLIPFGGYVKMLGQDDMDATQMTNEEIAEDPRSYSAKTVPQRMGIISAGVIMNIITGMLFFAIAFGIGVEQSPSTIGGTQPGSPSWQAGLGYGDRITRINNREIETFMDIKRGVALTNGPISITVERQNGEEFTTDSVLPDGTGSRRIIGAAPMMDSLKVIEPEDPKAPVTYPGTSASRLEKSQQFQAGDIIRKAGITGEEPQEFKSYPVLKSWLSQPEVRGATVDFYVERNGELLDSPMTLPPTKFRRLGLRLDISKITAVAVGSPAWQAGFKVGDQITHIDGIPVGTEMNPLDLPDYFYSRREGGELETVDVDDEDVRDVIVKVARRQEEGEDKDVTLQVRPQGDRPGWAYLPFGENVPMDVPSIGLAYHMLPSFILGVEENSAAAKAEIKKGERLSQIVFLPPEGEERDMLGSDKIEVILDEKKADGKQNWAYAFRLMQHLPARDVELTVINEEGESRQVKLSPETVDDWYLPDNRGLALQPEIEIQKANSVLDSFQMGITHTKNSASDIYLTLRNLVGGSISAKELHGPVGIAKVAYNVATTGLPALLLFLGFLSVNLAVLNFLPIPVLDGGHMVFLIWEGVTRSKPSERVVAAAQAVGILFVLGLMLFVLFLDIFVHGHMN